MSSNYSDISNEYKFYSEVNDTLNELNEPIQNEVKQIQINTYYYKKYKSKNQILYFIMIVLVIIILISLIKSVVPFIDENAYSIILSIILGFSLLYIIYSIWHLVHKDNQNFDEDQYMFDEDVNHIANVINADKYKECAKPIKKSIDVDVSYNVNDLLNEIK
jgi:predicted membrane channel-forming protein YqfA (hemolysin III family)